MSSVRVRFAPSPTGHLHIGGARTALFNYLFAKQQGGTYILRIEDTDQARNQEKAGEGFIEGFRWLDLLWDEGPDVGGDYGPYTSMERISIYQKYIDQLLKKGKAYPCFCTKEELEVEKEAVSKRGAVYRYSGTCRDLPEEVRAQYHEEGREYVIRLRVADNQEIEFHDLVRGLIHFRSADMDDYIIVKSNGVPVYNLAVTIDDALMKISHVIRGEEHISNTPCQILLYQALGWQVPVFAHLPLILNENGRKLSKRDESIIQFIDQYQELGYLPEAINNYLALLGWSPSGDQGEEEIFEMEDLLQYFSFDRVGKAGAIFDTEKLAWVNGQYIKKADLDRLVDLAIPYLQRAEYLQSEYDRDWVKKLVSIYQNEMRWIGEIVDLSRMFFSQQYTIDSEGEKVLAEDSADEVIQSFYHHLQQLEEFEPTQIKKLFKKVQKETGLRGKKLFMPIRVKITGQTQGPDLNTSIYLMGKEKALARLQGNG